MADGASKRQHLERVEARTGRRPPELDTPPIPAWALHIVDWWGELNAARGGNGMGPNPIGWSDLAAWAALTGTAPSPFEVRTILAIDHAWLAAQSAARKPPGPAAPPAIPQPRPASRRPR
jgi:hypothetical protein